jgi:hypothetical protein
VLEQHPVWRVLLYGELERLPAEACLVPLELHRYVAGLEHAFELLSARGEHHDRGPGGASDLAQDVAPVAVGEHDVEQDEIRTVVAEALATLGRGRGHRHLEPLPAERALREATPCVVARRGSAGKPRGLNRG